ncbi:MAG: rod shape-determining protein MreD [Actinobacteria bacterium]|nr:rod shape-determining protein MreD [Actinomycetota bacterium]MBM3697935.1 rod shape-determining protein MreD [Actinomycetota bacterium]
MTEQITGDIPAARPLPVGRIRSLPQRPDHLGRVAIMAVVAVLLQITLMPHLTVADGAPDICIALVVIVAVLRGPFVGVVLGFACGLAVELTTPVGTLGVLALLYLAAGYWCGRFVDRPEAESLGLPVALVMAASAFVQVGYAVFQLLLGTEFVVSAVAVQVIVPSILLTGLLSFPLLLVVRRLLGAPVDVEPGMLRS